MSANRIKEPWTPSAAVKEKLFIGRAGPFSQRFSTWTAQNIPAWLGGEVASYLSLGYPRSPAEPLIVERDGAIFSLDLVDATSRLHFLDIYENHLRALLLSGLKKGDLFIDVGANIGIFSLGAAARNAHVIAFEPVLATFNKLQCSMALNKNFNQLIETHQIALSDSHGTLELYSDDPEHNAGSISAHVEKGRRFKVPKTSLDTLLDPLPNPNHCILKIDVEGHEMNVLRGADRVITDLQPQLIAVEIVSTFLEKAGSSSVEVFDWLKDRGYFPLRASGIWPWIRYYSPPKNWRPTKIAATVVFEKRS